MVFILLLNEPDDSLLSFPSVLPTRTRFGYKLLMQLVITAICFILFHNQKKRSEK